MSGREKGTASGVVARAARWLGSSAYALLLPLGLFVALVSFMIGRPDLLGGSLQVGLKMPSEGAIPPSVLAPSAIEGGPQWKFRYAPTGTEFRAGIPYWIFRVMPAIFPDAFAGRGYDQFGFDEDDHAYYSSRPLPRGLALSDTEIYVPFAHTTVKLKRVSITCSGCHRGAYIDGKGDRVLVDGMPNHTGDLQSFKRFFASAFLDPRFSPERVVAEIDEALKADGKDALTPEERFAYKGIVEATALLSLDRTGAWMDRRAPNGPGRIDPFNAVKFEVLKVPDDGTAATLDFPSIWNQRDEVRSWHHSDGNTADSSARNFGSVVGVGGTALSVRKDDVQDVGLWINDLKPPPWPFERPDPAAVARGAAAFKAACAGCHGVFDAASNEVTWDPGGSYMKVVTDVGTDPERWKAFRVSTANVLNAFGERHALWGPGAFRGAPEGGTYGYLAGPLDGIWARAPYLHNGSVPNIAELLKAPADRVKCFYRGDRHYDSKNLGWVSTDPSADGRALFKYCTVQDPDVPSSPAIAGNSNAGHPYTVEPGKQADLIAYLKAL